MDKLRSSPSNNTITTGYKSLCSKLRELFDRVDGLLIAMSSPEAFYMVFLLVLSMESPGWCATT